MRFIGDGPNPEEMRKQVTDLKLDDRVRFLGPLYDREKLKTVYAAGDLLTFPSLYDNASLVTREAAGFDVPTLFAEGATTAAGIVDGVSGFLAKDSPEEYGGKISAVLQKIEILPTVGKCAREVLYASWEDVAEKVYTRYREIFEFYKWAQIDKVKSRSPKVRRPFSRKRFSTEH